MSTTNCILAGVVLSFGTLGAIFLQINRMTLERAEQLQIACLRAERSREQRALDIRCYFARLRSQKSQTVYPQNVDPEEAQNVAVHHINAAFKSLIDVTFWCNPSTHVAPLRVSATTGVLELDQLAAVVSLQTQIVDECAEITLAQRDTTLPYTVTRWRTLLNTTKTPSIKKSEFVSLDAMNALDTHDHFKVSESVIAYSGAPYSAAVEFANERLRMLDQLIAVSRYTLAPDRIPTVIAISGVFLNREIFHKSAERYYEERRLLNIGLRDGTLSDVILRRLYTEWYFFGLPETWHWTLGFLELFSNHMQTYGPLVNPLGI